MRLEGKTAIVTGAGRGLGKGIALKLAQEGASVMICDMVEENAQSVVQEIEASGGKASYQICNVAVLDEVNALFEKTLDAYGKVDILVNNAGINRDSMLHKMSVEQWDQVIAVNLTGTFYMTQAAAKLMREQESGAIINISSASWLGNVGQANYAASKAGVVGLTKTAARELAKKGVTCNAICPGFIETDMTRGVPEKVWDIMVGKIPMGRAGKPSDVANMVAFLASEEADYITGEVINVGGGMVL
ncbi:3-oxoacyl-ACP reductase FabG [Lactonifactor longoviformis]|uniref:3-oxoacyl-[acyl-carrier-protein] reductase n=1 Tax=Lactonifactor longoviformis DSM 17459 TaxID=1122155 RepID=A0A1M4YYN1_9CLOT|nr:3-oxoacyl-ACP reductase FabG [Lactonifactor longoviformis]POP32775.1 3-oxoacyl-ACP reductase FabG [Lactonifactor longoviformis]SHF10808.1 3-oxoacyl-[acyl-carrier-protein] reductase [Lactonifactor longoviformis DSM 17459]